MRYKSQIETLLPRFNSLLVEVRLRQVILLEDQDYQMGLKIRKELLDLFAQVERVAKLIKALSVTGPSTKQLYFNVSVSIGQYLQQRMFTLKLMPSTTPKGDQRLEALSIQIEQMEEQLKEATLKRRFEDVPALKEALEDLYQERKMLI